jgi:hypothetical protein
MLLHTMIVVLSLATIFSIAAIGTISSAASTLVGQMNDLRIHNGIPIIAEKGKMFPGLVAGVVVLEAVALVGSGLYWWFEKKGEQWGNERRGAGIAGTEEHHAHGTREKVATNGEQV